MAVELNRPPLPNDNFWNELMATLDLDEEQIAEVKRFKEFIQIPNNGFLILDVLDKFIETCSFLSGEEINPTLKSYVELAKILQVKIRVVFLRPDREDWSLKIAKVKMHI